MKYHRLPANPKQTLSAPTFSAHATRTDFTHLSIARLNVRSRGLRASRPLIDDVVLINSVCIILDYSPPARRPLACAPKRPSRTIHSSHGNTYVTAHPNRPVWRCQCCPRPGLRPSRRGLGLRGWTRRGWRSSCRRRGFRMRPLCGL